MTERDLIQAMYWAMSDSMEMLDQYSDINDNGGANPAMYTMMTFHKLLEKAAQYLKETDNATASA